MNYLPQRTVHYKTYVKTALVEALSGVFEQHKDQLLQRTKVVIDFPRTEADYPAIVVRFYERDITNSGVAHEEWITGMEGDRSTLTKGAVYRFKHYLYTGDLEFAVHALSSKDRDLVSDTLVQTVAMGNLEGYTNNFFNRIYPDESQEKYPDAIWHYININSDVINGFGETQRNTPWASEDELIYQTSYRIHTFGEFYSVPPDAPAGIVSKVLQYPYIHGVEPVPEGTPGDGAPWIPPLNLSDD